MYDKRSAGTIFQLRQKLPWPRDKDFRILSIDGGGIKGILPAAILARTEAELTSNGKLGQHFDLIAGTSTGGIIALGLGLGIPARSILDVYLEKGSAIFPSAPRPFRGLGRVLGGLKQIAVRRYHPGVLDEALQSVLKGSLFGEAQCRLVVPAFDHNTEPCIFKTPHHPDYKMDWAESALTVARATSAAPTYLEGFEQAGRRFWDGGVFANNPIMMAVTDALACYDIDRRQIRILSIGCATDRPKMTKSHLKSGQLGWRNAHAVASSLQSHDALGQAGLLIGRDRLLRIDASPAQSIEMDDYHSASEVLPDVANRLFAENLEAIKSFVETPTDPFVAYHGPRSTPPKPAAI